MDNAKVNAMKSLSEAAGSVQKRLEELATVTGGFHSTHPVGTIAQQEVDQFVLQLYQTALQQVGESSQDATQNVAQFIDAPVFVGGVHKSGTTLLRNLMDGHSQMVVMPADGLGFRWLRALASQDPVLSAQEIYSRLARSMIAPMPGSEPTWILGTDVGAYLGFARSFASWMNKFKGEKAAVMKAAVCAYHAASWIPGAGTPVVWADKSTANIENTQTLLGLFPRARFVHIVRHPAAVIAAQKRKQPLKGNAFGLFAEIALLQRGLGLGVWNVNQLGKNTYHLIRYEDLVQNPEEAMRGLADFLHLQFDPILLTPTVNGRPAGSNTAYSKDKPVAAGKISVASVSPWRSLLSESEIQVVMGCLHPLLKLYGYDGERPSFAQYLAALFRVRRMYAQSREYKAVGLGTGLRCWLRGRLSVPSRPALF